LGLLRFDAPTIRQELTKAIQVMCERELDLQKYQRSFQRLFGRLLRQPTGVSRVSVWQAE
jgi:hypothetical protein